MKGCEKALKAEHCDLVAKMQHMHGRFFFAGIMFRTAPEDFKLIDVE